MWFFTIKSKPICWLCVSLSVKLHALYYWVINSSWHTESTRKFQNFKAFSIFMVNFLKNSNILNKFVDFVCHHLLNCIRSIACYPSQSLHMHPNYRSGTFSLFCIHTFLTRQEKICAARRWKLHFQNYFCSAESQKSVLRIKRREKAVKTRSFLSKKEVFYGRKMG